VTTYDPKSGLVCELKQWQLETAIAN